MFWEERSRVAARTVWRIIFCVAIILGISKKPFMVLPLKGDACCLRTVLIDGNSSRLSSAERIADLSICVSACVDLLIPPRILDTSSF